MSPEENYKTTNLSTGIGEPHQYKVNRAPESMFGFQDNKQIYTPPVVA